MKTFIVSYDLCKPGRDYSSLLARIRALGGMRPLESFWVLKGDYTADALRDDLARHIDGNDRLLVYDTEIKRWAWSGTLKVDLKVSLGLA
jgi:hypothetical protein